MKAGERAGGAALVLGVAVLCAFWGLDLRDLSSTELEEFSGSGPLEILRRSITPTENDWGAHMPLTHLIRWWVVELLDGTRAWVWRLHTALASVAAAALLHRGLSERMPPSFAAAAGLLLAVHPVVSFHAHESTNYGFGALFGTLLLLAVLRWEEGRPRAGPLLGVVLVLGLASDLFFVFPACAAVGWVGWRAIREPEARRRLTQTLCTAATLLAGPALWLGVHMARLGTDGLITPHADPVPSEQRGLLGSSFDLLARFVGGSFGGYADAAEWERWTTLGPLLLLLAAALGLLGPPRIPQAARTAATLAVGSFLAVWLARTGFTVATGREFTTEPRIYTALLPSLVVAWVGLCASARRPALGRLAALGLLAALSIATARQLATLSDRDRRAAATITAGFQPGDAIIATRQVRWRLAPSLQDAVVPCISGPSRVWMAVEGDGEERQRPPLCDEVSPPLLHARLHERLSPPQYERKSASYLPELTLSLHVPGPEPAGPRPLRVAGDRGFLGARDLRIEARLYGEQDGRPDDRREPAMERAPFDAPAFPPQPEGSWVRLSARPAEEPSATFFGLLAPLRSPQGEHERVPVLAAPLRPATLVVPALSAPTLLIAEHLLRTLLGLALFGVALRQGVRRLRGPPA